MGCLSSLFYDNMNYDNNNPLKTNNEIIDKILSSAPERNKTTLKELIKYFNSQSESLSLTEQDKVLLVYKWIANNISFDCERFMNNLKNKDDVNYLAQEEIFSLGKGINHDYSSLFETILSEIDSTIKIYIIEGYIKDFLYKYGKEYDEPNHEWIAVKINFRWHLLDPMFGAGYYTYSNKILKFISDYNPFYFFPNPNIFIKTHFPKEEKWQLIPKKIKINDFYKIPIIKNNFYKLGLKSIVPEEGILNINKEGKITINFQKSTDITNLFINVKMSYKEDNKSKNLKNSILVEKRETFFNVYFYINKNIEHKLTIFGTNSNNNNDEDFKELVVYKIINKNNSNDNVNTINNDNLNSNYFPTFFDKYILSDIILIEPRNFYLVRGEKINFKIETKMYEKNLFLILEDENGDEMIELEKKDNGFEENEIFIHGSKVNLAHLNDNNNYMDYLIEYRIIDNPNIKEKITFPKSSKAVKNKLLEPLCDSLKKGEIFNFKIEIKNNNVDEVIVIDGDNNNVLNKEGYLYYKEIKIEGKENALKIAYKEKEENAYKVLYTYKII